MKTHQYWLIYIVILCISSCSEETPSIDTTNAVTAEYLESVGIDLITGEFEQIANSKQQNDISKLVSGDLAAQIQFDANSLDFLYPKNIYFYVTTLGAVCVSSNLNASIDRNCYNRLENIGYSFFTALDYENTATTPHQHILLTINSLTHYVALFTDRKQTASYFSLKNLPSLNNLSIEVELYLDAQARADNNLKLYLHYGNYGIIVERNNDDDNRKFSIHHGGVTSGQTYPAKNQTSIYNGTNTLSLKIQLSETHTSNNSDDTYASVNGEALKLSDNYMTLANPKGTVDFTITAYKHSGDNDYKVLLKSIKICESAC